MHPQPKSRSTDAGKKKVVKLTQDALKERLRECRV
jgi:hypothetical protein